MKCSTTTLVTEKYEFERDGVLGVLSDTRQRQLVQALQGSTSKQAGLEMWCWEGGTAPFWGGDSNGHKTEDRDAIMLAARMFPQTAMWLEWPTRCSTGDFAIVFKVSARLPHWTS